MTTQAQLTDIAAVLQQAQQAEQLVQAQQPASAQIQTAEVAPVTSESAKTTVSTKVSGRPPVDLPSQSERGQATIAEVTQALNTSAANAQQFSNEANKQLKQLLGMEGQVRKNVSDLKEATIEQTKLEQNNKVAVAKANSSAASRYNTITNDDARNAQFNSLLQEQTKLQGELQNMNLFERLFIAPGVRKDLTAVQNSILATQQQRGNAASNYWNSRKINTANQEDYTAEEARTIAIDMGVAQAGIKEFEQQGIISERIMGQLASAANLNSAARVAFEAKVNGLIKEDNITLGALQASIEQARLEQTKLVTKRTLEKADKESLAWKELEDKFAQFNADTNNESGITSIEGLSAADPDSPIIQRFNSYLSRTQLMTNQKPWTERLLRMEDGTWDVNDPNVQARDRQMKLAVEAINKKIKKNNAKLTPPEHAPLLDPNSNKVEDAKALDEALAEQFAADKQDIEEAVDQGRAQFVDLKSALAATPKEQWRTEFPELLEEDLKFIAEGGMDKLPTAITQSPVRTINSMISIMAEEVADLPPREARITLLRQSRILAGFYKNQVQQMGQLEILGLDKAQVFGVDNFKVGDSVDDKFEMTNTSDWAMRATSAYIERVRAKKIGAQTSVLGQTRGL